MTKQVRVFGVFTAVCAISLGACSSGSEQGAYDDGGINLGGATEPGEDVPGEGDVPGKDEPTSLPDPLPEVPPACEREDCVAPPDNPCSEEEVLIDGKCVSQCENGATDFPSCVTCPDQRLLVDGKCEALCENGAVDPPSCGACAEGEELVDGSCEASCTNGAVDAPSCTICLPEHVFSQGACYEPCTNGSNNPPSCNVCINPVHDPSESCATCLSPFAGYPTCQQCESPDQDPAYGCWTEEEKLAHLLKIKSVADHAQYECSTPQGNIYFRYAYGINEPDQDYLYFYPVYNAAEPDTSCNNPSYGEVSGRQRCSFFDTGSGRWSLYLGKPLEMDELPVTITQRIATGYDCDNYALQSGITPEICNAEYTCTLYTFNDAWPGRDDDEDGVSNAEDCAPYDVERWHYDVASVDVDFDGVPTREEHVICMGSVLPPGYVQESSEADNCPNYYNPAQDDSDEDLVGDLCDVNHLDLSDAPTREAHFAALLAEAQARTYECETPRGNVYFKWAYGADATDRDYLYAYPTSNGVEGSCTNASHPVGPGRQKCVFYDNGSGRWSLSLGRPTQLSTLPEAFYTSIGVGYDCENYDLQSGVTPEMCSDKYWCTLLD